MTLEALAEFVDDMIVQNDYPGFEPRSYKIGLSQELLKGPTKVFGQALGHPSVYVKLVALRWFQERPQYLKPYTRPVLAMVDDEDKWLRMESIMALERLHSPTMEMAEQISKRLFDEEIAVQQVAARALGKMGKRLKLKDGEVVEALNKVAQEGDALVRRKAEKALRKIGLYS